MSVYAIKLFWLRIFSTKKLKRKLVNRTQKKVQRYDNRVLEGNLRNGGEFYFSFLKS